jgi:hypothetical protein
LCGLTQRAEIFPSAIAAIINTHLQYGPIMVVAAVVLQELNIVVR